MPHSRTLEIIKNLGCNDDIIQTLTHLEKSGKKRSGISLLKKLGFPESALDQIRILESEPEPEKLGNTNQELLSSLLKKCKRSFDAFAKKGVRAKLQFKKSKNQKIVWTLDTKYDLTVKKFYETNKKWFDKWANQGLIATILFDGTSWTIKQ